MLGRCPVPEESFRGVTGETCRRRGYGHEAFKRHTLYVRGARESRQILLKRSLSRPASAQALPVDLDGDGVSTYGDRAVFDDWQASAGGDGEAARRGSAP